MYEYSIEMTNEDTCEVLTRSFGTEEERASFIEQLPPHIDWALFENMNLFVDLNMSLG